MTRPGLQVLAILLQRNRVTRYVTRRAFGCLFKYLDARAERIDRQPIDSPFVEPPCQHKPR